MPYLSKKNENTLITSWDPRVGLEVVTDFEKQHTLTEVDTYLFTLIAPKVEPQVNELYHIWMDQQMTKKIGCAYILSTNREPITKHPLVRENTEYKIFKPIGVGPSHFLKKKRINVRRSNITMTDLAKLVIRKAGLEFGISADFSYVQEINYTFEKIRFVSKTPEEIFQKLREYGIQYYVDDDFKFHFFEDKNEFVGLIFDDNTSFVSRFVLAPDISDLKNAVKITGSDSTKEAPDLKIKGTGDLTTGLDFPLPHNVVFQQELKLENWNDIDQTFWQISDSLGSSNPLSPDGSRIFANNSVLVVDGGNNTQGSNYIQALEALPRQDGHSFFQNISIDNFGNGFVFAVGDGNGATDADLFGFYLKTNGTLTIYERGVEQAPAFTVSVKRSFTETTALVISNLSGDKKSFDLPASYGQYFTAGERITLIGDVIGVHQTIVDSMSTDRMTVVDALPSSDITNAKLNRVIDYRLKIQLKSTGFIYEIQGDGDTYGGFNTGAYTIAKETSTDDTDFLFCVPGAPKDANCKFQISDTFIVPTGGATFVVDNKKWLVAPEDLGSPFDFPVLIRQADNKKNPPLFRFRPPRIITTVNGGGATTSQIPVNPNDWPKIYVGDRLLVNQQETFVTSKEVLGSKLNISPNLSGSPVDATLVYVGTTAAADGQDGIFTYNFPMINRRFFQDQDSIELYGYAEAEPIKDPNLISSEDLNGRWAAFKEDKAQPKITGQVVYEVNSFPIV